MGTGARVSEVIEAELAASLGLLVAVSADEESSSEEMKEACLERS